MALNPEAGVAIVADPTGKYQVVYSSPLVRLPNSKRTSSLPIEWDADSSSLVVNLPSLEAPIILAFGLTFQIPEKPQLAFPSFKVGFVKPLKRIFGGVGVRVPIAQFEEEQEEEESEEEVEPIKLEYDPSKFPSYEFGKSWNTVLYGNEFKSLRPAYTPAANKLRGFELQADLFTKGHVDYSKRGWKVRLTPNLKLTGRKLLRTGNLLLVRGDNGEVGLFNDVNSCRHFVLFGKAPTKSKLILKLEV